MTKKISKNQEFNHFTNIAKEWWIPEGKFKILHEILPIRIEYILDNFNKDIKNLDILDLGCGGGLTCEPLAKLGGNITGLDFVKENVEIAKKHSIKSKLKIKYIHADIDIIKIKQKFDLILVLEVLEHLQNWENFIKKLKKNLKPNGVLIISTINKTQFAKYLGIFVAENILNWIPKNTHDYNKFIKPNDLKKILKKNNYEFKNLQGMNYNPLSREWSLSKAIYPINYFCTAKLI